MFSSYVKGRAHPASDLDVLLVLSENNGIWDLRTKKPSQPGGGVSGRRTYSRGEWFMETGRRRRLQYDRVHREIAHHDNDRSFRLLRALICGREPRLTPIEANSRMPYLLVFQPGSMLALTSAETTDRRCTREARVLSQQQR